MPDSSFRGRRDALRLACSALLGLAGAGPAPLRAQERTAAPAGSPGRRDAPFATADVPTYRTRIPPSATVSYRLSRSGIVGQGLLDWQVEGDRYRLRLEGSVPLFGTLIVQTSQGGFDAAGLAPLRYTDKRLRRAERTASFDREAGRIVFSGDRPARPLQPGVQDRLSVMVQLAAIANAWTEAPATGTVLTVPVVGAKGDARLWALRYEGPQSLQTPQGPVRALRFLRQPDDPGDTTAEFWLDPALSCLPVRARLTDGDGDALELLRSGPAS